MQHNYEKIKNKWNQSKQSIDVNTQTQWLSSYSFV